jgi:hypothetical protein
MCCNPPFLRSHALVSFVSGFPVLHPRHKLAYFKKSRWEPEWIENAETLVREVFKTYKERASTPDEDSTNADITPTTVSVFNV